ncbi:TPA: hypothetical protein N0F65_008456 [Lagenidium giganteum]|uniref:Alpha-tubulin N-acetyltransferase n=1 Tax=Lagenidium giganteum TaxID=4803 RepID=A0AAV2YNV1_9STRA|nr:TPA: hypothetical protein N0F65_008456 [Lagenidium giganteum]
MNVVIEVVTRPAEWAMQAQEHVVEALNELGRKSAVAQQLNRPITSVELLSSANAIAQQQMLLLTRDGATNEIVGYLKTGVKHLFYVDTKGQYKELDPLCLLDFYVDEQFQRHGIGLQLFEELLRIHGVTASQVAYDRPSPKLYAFLKKHYQLTAFIPQPNNFVVFDAYFQ